MTATFYDVLDVPTDATAEEIEAAYREQVKRYHPDVSDHPEAEARFRAVVRAEEVLGDPDERARYDRLGHEAYLRVVGGPGEDGDPDGASSGRGDGSAGREASSSADRTGGSATDRTGGSATERSDGSSADRTGGSTADRAGRSSTDRTGRSTSRTGGSSTGRTGGSSADRTDEAWWREAWEPGTGEDNWRQATDPERRSYTPGDGGSAAAGRAADVAAAAERERKRWQSAGRGNDDSFWSAEVDAPVDPGPRDGPVARNVRSRDTAVMSLTLLVIYPVFVYFSVASTAPVITVAAAVATVGVAVLSLLEPAVSLLVFGSWSVASPLVLLFLGHSLLSLTALVVLAAFWIPLAMTGLVAVVAPR